ncbi:hypothetical protein PQX77_002027, partial [Marasmius sp. AFHP31]
MLCWYLLTQLILTVCGVELSVPSSWNKPTVEASREERINRTAAAIDAFIASDTLFTSAQPPSNLSDTYWPHGAFLALIADFDIFTNQTRYMRIAQERFLPALQQTTPDTIQYGYAATRAYLAYKDEGFLNIAKDYWASERNLTLSDADVESNSSPAKSKINSSISLACSKPGAEFTLAGGTFHSTDQNDLLITTGSTADYLTLTVSLGTVPSNLDPVYMTLAGQMGQFMRSALYIESGVFYTGINMTGTDPDCPTRYGGTRVYYTASTMHSLSLLVLSSKNDTLTDVLREVALGATGNSWNSADGVLDTQKVADANDVKSDTAQATQQLLRSYHDLVHADGASDLKAYLRAYLAIQYDALVKQATFASGVLNLYGSGLRPEGRLDPQAQRLAITILLGGVISSEDTTPNGTRGSDTEDHRRVPIGAIVGGVVGGILGLVFVVAGSYYCLRRRRRLQSSLPTVEPYQATSPSMTPPPLSTIPASRSRRYEKKTPSASPSISERTATYSEFSTLTAPRPAPEPHSSRVPREATTAELVTLLNQRLGLESRDVNNEQWAGARARQITVAKREVTERNRDTELPCNYSFGPSLGYRYYTKSTIMLLSLYKQVSLSTPPQLGKQGEKAEWRSE